MSSESESKILCSGFYDDRQGTKGFLKVADIFFGGGGGW